MRHLAWQRSEHANEAIGDARRIEGGSRIGAITPGEDTGGEAEAATFGAREGVQHRRLVGKRRVVELGETRVDRIGEHGFGEPAPEHQLAQRVGQWMAGRWRTFAEALDRVGPPLQADRAEARIADDAGNAGDVAEESGDGDEVVTGGAGGEQRRQITVALGGTGRRVDLGRRHAITVRYMLNGNARPRS